MKGVLYIVSTPIGNLSDMTLRAIETLKNVDFIAAEDTRHSRKLMEAYSITTPLFSFHEFNEASRIEKVTSLLDQGKDVALVSDAGTPLISDPGFKLVSDLRKAGFRVSPIPGACAAIAGLSVSGLPSDRFYFEGFLPAKGKARSDRLEALEQLEATLILYESPHRLLNLFELIGEIYSPYRQLCLARELTKKFETLRSGNPAEMLDFLREQPEQLKGECVVFVSAAKKDKSGGQITAEIEKLLSDLKPHMPPGEVAAIVSRFSGIPKKKLYQQLLSQKK